MKILATDPLAEAALELAQSALDSRDPKVNFIFDKKLSFTFDLYSNGSVAIQADNNGPGRITLSMAGYFKTNPVLRVTAKNAKVGAGPVSKDIPKKMLDSTAFKTLSEAKIKEYKAKYAS